MHLKKISITFVVPRMTYQLQLLLLFLFNHPTRYTQIDAATKKYAHVLFAPHNRISLYYLHKSRTSSVPLA